MRRSVLVTCLFALAVGCAAETAPSIELADDPMLSTAVGSAKADGLTLDFEQLLFHSNHWQDPRRDVYLDEAAALLRSRRTNSTPAFLHYNGYTKEGTVWRWPRPPRPRARPAAPA